MKAWKRTLHELYPDETKITTASEATQKALRIHLFLRDRSELVLYEDIAKLPNVSIAISDSVETDNDSWLDD